MSRKSTAPTVYTFALGMSVSILTDVTLTPSSTQARETLVVFIRRSHAFLFPVPVAFVVLVVATPFRADTQQNEIGDGHKASQCPFPKTLWRSLHQGGETVFPGTIIEASRRDAQEGRMCASPSHICPHRMRSRGRSYSTMTRGVQ